MIMFQVPMGTVPSESAKRLGERRVCPIFSVDHVLVQFAQEEAPDFACSFTDGVSGNTD